MQASKNILTRLKYIYCTDCVTDREDVDTRAKTNEIAERLGQGQINRVPEPPQQAVQQQAQPRPENRRPINRPLDEERRPG